MTDAPDTQEIELAIPDMRQAAGDDSAVACLYAVLAYYGIDEPAATGAFVDMLEASQVGSVHPDDLVAAAEDAGLSAQAGSLDLVGLTEALQAGKPVICAVQDTDDDGDEPHYVVVCGFATDADGGTADEIIVQDPAQGRIRLSLAEWSEWWRYTGWGVVLDDAEAEREWRESEEAIAHDDAESLAQAYAAHWNAIADLGDPVPESELHAADAELDGTDWHVDLGADGIWRALHADEMEDRYGPGWVTKSAPAGAAMVPDRFQDYHPMPIGSFVTAREPIYNYDATSGKWTFEAASQEKLEVIGHEKDGSVKVRNKAGQEAVLPRHKLRGKTTGRGHKLPKATGHEEPYHRGPDKREEAGETAQEESSGGLSREHPKRSEWSRDRGTCKPGQTAKETGCTPAKSYRPRRRKAREQAPKGGVTLTNKKGESHFYRGGQWIPAKAIAELPKEEKEKLEQAKEESKSKRAGRGHVEESRLRERLSSHAQELSKKEMQHAAKQFRALHSHHGELTLHRLEELTEQAEKTLAKAGAAPGTMLDRQLRGNLARLHAMLDMAKERGVTGQVSEETLAKAQQAAARAALPKQPQAGKVYNVATNELQVDPERFQYKLVDDKVHGVGKELKSVKTWDPELAGVIGIWRDPADGKDYVVNGHHRFELASRLGVKDLNVIRLDAATAKEARGKGALMNIAEGRGTAMDAAKFMRDTGFTPEDMEQRGISLSGRIAGDAVLLSRLSDRAFRSVIDGRLDERKAIAVAAHLNDHALQDKLFSLLDKREEEGKDLKLSVVEEMARKMAAAGKVKTTERTLFGDIESEDSLFVPLAEVSLFVRNSLGKEVNDWLAVANKRRAEKVGGAGNVLNVEENKKIAQQAEEVKNVYEQLAESKGPIADALNAAAAEYHGAKTKKEREDVKQRALEAVRDAVLKESGFGSEQRREVESGGKGPAVSGRGGTAESEPGTPAETHAENAGRGDTGETRLKPPEPGFTGTDANGHQWVNGEQVARGEEEKKPHAGQRITVHGVGDMGDFDLEVKGVKDGKVQIGQPNSPHAFKAIPEKYFNEFVNDLSGKVDVPPNSGNAAIDAVASGKAKFLGKGDDGLAFQVGDKVVKASTIVPFIPTNPGDRTPMEADNMLRKQTETSEAMRKAGVPGILPTEFISHGGKGFQIRDHVDIPDKLTPQQLEKVRGILETMHAKGYSLNDQVQVGIHNGEPVLFDVGKASKLPKSERAAQDQLEIDDINLNNLYRENGRSLPVNDPLDINTLNLPGIWEQNKEEILAAGGPQMSPALAGSLAAARILNAVDNRAADVRKEIDDKVKRGEETTLAEDDRYYEAQEARRKLYQPLVDLSGYRPQEVLDEHPEARKPIAGVKQKAEAKPAVPTHAQPKIDAALSRYANRASTASGGGLFGGEDLQAREGFAKLPDNAPIVFTAGEFEGKTGRIVHDEDPISKQSRIVAEVDGRKGLVPISPDSIEPLNENQSWRVEGGGLGAGTKQTGLFAGTLPQQLRERDERKAAEEAAAPHSVEPPPETKPIGNGERIGKDGTTWIKAPMGGQVSPVNGQHYKGGQWMPIHGLSEKQPEVPKKPKDNGSLPPKSNEEGRGRQREQRQPMTPEQIEALRQQQEADTKWSDVRGGVLGNMISMGAKPHQVKPVTNLKKWKEYAESVGEPKMEELTRELQPMMEKVIRESIKPGQEYSPEDLQWAMDSAKRAAADHAQMFSGSKGHLKNVPSSFLARAMLQEVLNHASVDDLHKLNQMLARSVESSSKPASLDKQIRELETALQQMPRASVAEADMRRQLDGLKNERDRQAGEAKPPEPGFTGIDANGHKWENGVQVARGEDNGKNPPNGGGEKPKPEEPKVHQVIQQELESHSGQFWQGEIEGVKVVVMPNGAIEVANARMVRGDFEGAARRIAQIASDRSKTPVVKPLSHTVAKPIKPEKRKAPGKWPQAARPELSDREVEEVNTYLDEQTPYYDVNEHLRSGGKLFGDALLLQSAIEKASPLVKPIAVYRGLQVDDPAELLSQLKSGHFTDAGFMSTSTNINGSFEGNVQFKILAKHGLDASHYGSNRDEFLLPAGSEFRVLSVLKEKGKIVADLEQII